MSSPGAAAKSQLCNADKHFTLKLTFIPTTFPHHIFRLPALSYISTPFLSFPSLPCPAPPAIAFVKSLPRMPYSSQTGSAAVKSPPDNLTVQETGNASLAITETLAGAIANDRHVAAKDLASMHVNSESVSNEIDESELHDEKHDEQRI
jgi:hypothetical protein